jgi:hypothetical protein
MGLYDKKPQAILWPDVATPRERVGTIPLYYFPPAQNSPAGQP